MMSEDNNLVTISVAEYRQIKTDYELLRHTLEVIRCRVTSAEDAQEVDQALADTREHL